MKKHILILLILPILFSFTQNDSCAITCPSSNSITPENINLTEGQAYKMLYENQVKSNDAILNTIFYALSGLAASILAVFASNWWFNEKKVKDVAKGIDLQIADIKTSALAEVSEKINEFSIKKTEEITLAQIKLQEEITNSITNLNAKYNELTEKLRFEIKSDNKTLLENYQKQLDSFNENYRQQITNLNESIHNQTEDLKNNVKLSNERTTNEINKILKDISRNEYYMWKYGGAMVNALRAQLKELKLVNKSEKDHPNYGLYLDQILNTIQQLPYFYLDEKLDLISTINKTPSKYDDLKNQILVEIEKIEIKTS